MRSSSFLPWLLGLTVSTVSAEEGLAPAAKVVNEFAAAQLRHLPAGNALASPWSMETLLGLLTAGANGSTRAAMQKAFFLEGHDETALHESFRAMHEAVLGEAKKTGGGVQKISAASQLFVARDLRLQPAWEDTARLHFKAGAQAADFLNNATAEASRINRWAEEQTHGKIPAVTPAGSINSGTCMVLVNAMYFDMSWDERFTKELTQERPFYLSPRRAKMVPLMFKQHALRYVRKGSVQIAALPFVGGVFQFVVILPDSPDGLPAVEARITGALLSECAALNPAEVRLFMPRIALSPPVVDFKQTLSDLGASEMFDENKADFSRMIQPTGAPRPYVSDVFHGTFIDLDEDGAKAASASSAIIVRKNGHPREVPHEVVRADRPFLFMIQHVASGTCLFLGRMADPSPSQPDHVAPIFPPPEITPARKK